MLLKSHSYKKRNRKYTQSCSQNYAIKLFLKKASDQVCFGGIDRFCKYFFFLHSTSFAIGENSPEIVFKKLHFIFFRWITSGYLYLLKFRVVFFQ